MVKHSVVPTVQLMAKPTSAMEKALLMVPMLEVARALLTAPLTALLTALLTAPLTAPLTAQWARRMVPAKVSWWGLVWSA
jgi:hypothetical protein